jgi:cell shape-determining protein MreC
MKTVLTALQKLQESARTQSGKSFMIDVYEFLNLDLDDIVDELQQDQIFLDKLERENMRLRRHIKTMQKIRATKKRVTA